MITQAELTGIVASLGRFAFALGTLPPGSQRVTDRSWRSRRSDLGDHTPPIPLTIPAEIRSRRRCIASWNALFGASSDIGCSVAGVSGAARWFHVGFKSTRFHRNQP
jgi:hypothetical protein